MLSRDKRLPLDTWNTFGLQENVFGNIISTFDSPPNHPQRIQSDNVQREPGAVPQATDKIKAQFQCRHLQQGSRLSSSIPVDFPQNSMVGQLRQQISETAILQIP